ncbi:hypothetical protein [Argonema galeatum]|uniref:hypothetical protein n=1 Tax=Argonema galeatum TaxID=2942762 RepID=UPI002013308A|nr:hypothetical protein [Argonema galeatum]MCL1464353.1 hypothetical protein [Argonema galeatum A003/A1]
MIAFLIPKKFDRIPHPQKARSHSPSPKSSIAYGTLRERIPHPSKKAIALSIPQKTDRTPHPPKSSIAYGTLRERTPHPQKYSLSFKEMVEEANQY